MKKVNIKTVLKRASFGFLGVALMAGAVGCSSDNEPTPGPGNNGEAPSDETVVTEPMHGLNKTAFPSLAGLNGFLTENLVVAEGHTADKYATLKIESEYGTVHHLLFINPGNMLSDNGVYGFKTDGGIKKEFEVPACGGSFIVYWGMKNEDAPEIREIGRWYVGEEALAQYTYDYFYSAAAPGDGWKEFADFSAEDKAAVMDAAALAASGEFVTELRIPENRTGEPRRLFVRAQSWGHHDQYCGYYDEEGCSLSHDVSLLLPITQMP